MTKTEELMTENAKAAQEIIARNAKEVDRERRFPRENITALGRCRVLGLLVPVEHGGAGGGLAEMSRALEQLAQACPSTAMRSEEHTSELQSHHDLVCRLLLEKKKQTH